MMELMPAAGAEWFQRSFRFTPLRLMSKDNCGICEEKDVL